MRSHESGWFKASEPFWTMCNARLVGEVHMSSGWFEPRVALRRTLVGEVHTSSGLFDATEPFRTTCSAKNMACG